jgi:hypothetical protein
MAIGDQADCESRIKALLPQKWFNDSSPVKDALVSGCAWALSLVYSLIQYAQNQTRIATATDGFLDLIGWDYFGGRLPRRQQETDAAYRARIQANLLLTRTTRQGMVNCLVALTGRAPIIFEPARPLDTGAYGASICGYGSAGGYGSQKLPAQAFIIAYRPSGSGIPNIGGYGSTPWGYSTASQGEYASLSMIQGYVTDADIFACVDAAKPAGTTAWTRLSN